MFGLSSLATSLIGYGLAAAMVTGAFVGVRNHLANDAERAHYVEALERGIKIKADADAAMLKESAEKLAAARADAALNRAGIDRLLELAADNAPALSCSAAIQAVQRSLK